MLVRSLLMVGVLAIVFAPGALEPAPQDETASAMAAAVLAPTTLDHAGVTAQRPRLDEGDVLLLATVGVIALVYVARPAWRRRRDNDVHDVDEQLLSRPANGRRGPPALAF